MADDSTVAELILKIVADSSEVRQALQESSDATGQFAKDTKASSDSASAAVDSVLNKTKDHAQKTNADLENLGTHLRVISRSMIMLGTVMMAPVVGALAATQKSSAQVGVEMFKLSETTRQFSEEIALAALPVVEKFTKFIGDLSDWFKRLDPNIKQAIVQFLLVGGATLIVVGTLTRLIYMFKVLWPVVKAVGDLWTWLNTSTKANLISPLSLTLAALALFAVAYVNNWFDIQTIVTKILTNIGKGADWLKDKLVFDTAFYIALSHGHSFEDSIKIANEIANKFAAEQGPKMEDVLKNIGNDAAEVAKKIKDLMSSGGGAGAAPAMPGTTGLSRFNKELTAGFKLGLGQMAKDLSDWGKVAVNMVTTISQSMQSAFSDFFFDLFTGQLKSASEYFASFGEAILRAITNLIAQLIALWVVVTMLNAIPGGAEILKALGMASYIKKHEGGTVMHEGGPIRKAHDGLAAGEFPVIAQTGEGYLSRNGMATLGEDGLNRLNQGRGSGGGSPIYLIQNIQSWDASDVIRNKKSLATGMIEELMNNGALRGAIKRYT